MNVNGGQRENRPLMLNNVVIRALCGNARTGEPVSRLRGDDGLYARNPSKPDERSAFRTKDDRPGLGTGARSERRAILQDDGGETANGPGAMGRPETHVSALCEALSITRQTLYRHVGPNGELRPDGETQLTVGRRAPACG